MTPNRPSNGGSLLDVRGLSVRFATDDGIVHAVEDVSFSLEAGETLAIVGESGSGKSVTALSLMGLVPSPPGSVTGAVDFRGRDVLTCSADELRRIRGRDIAMVFQDPMSALNPVFTVGSQLMEPLRIHLGMGRAAARRRAAELLALVEIGDAARRIDDHPHQFSGGQRQRIMIAMALACEPALLIADEPTTALDVTVQAQIIELMGRLQDRVGAAIIVITHDLGVVARIADRIAVMYAGRLVEVAGAATLFADPRHPYTWGLLDSIPRLDAPPGARLTPITGSPPSLIARPSGCAFHPRCRAARERCRAERPELVESGDGHRAACFFQAEALALRPRAAA